MRTILTSALAILLATYSFSNEKMYTKLNKLYLTDRAKCMEKSKQILEKKKFEAIPHYFRSIIYYDKSKESSTVKGNYLNLNRSISSAIKFEQLSGDQERDLVHWDEHIASLKNKVEILLPQLDKNGMQDLTSNLTQNILKVESLAKYFKVEPTHQETEPAKEELVVHSKIEGHFYGMPDGTERITSSDVGKEKELLILINLERAKRNLPGLIWNDNLANASRYHAFDQATQSYLSHSTQDVAAGKMTVQGDAMTRIKRFSKSIVPSGECISAGNELAVQTLKQWLNSPTHRDILLDPATKTAGIGFVELPESQYETYWVLATGK